MNCDRNILCICMYSLCWVQAQLEQAQAARCYEREFACASHAYRAKVWQVVCPIIKHLRDMLLTFFQIQHVHSYLQNKTCTRSGQPTHHKLFVTALTHISTDKADEHKSEPDKVNTSV